jgi:2-polyprenyl-6-methoxyphenol hydroxylase-like FAD-dependent oxidoreductase
VRAFARPRLCAPEHRRSLVPSAGMPPRTPVLIVGAGPTGLTLAIELQRRGVAHRIIERDLEPHTQSRATDIQARSLEVFDDIGIIDEALAAGQRRRSATIRSDGRLLVRLDFGDADTPYPCALGLAQHDTQAILEARLEALGGRVERGVRLACFEQDDDAEGVAATLLYADGRWDEPRFDWLVGCDGARSGVRRSLAIEFDGSTFAESFFLFDADLDTPWPNDELLLVATPQGMAVIGPLAPGRVRVMGDLDPDACGELDDATCLAIVRARMGPEVAVAKLGWRALFRVNTRMAARYRKGRALLAGDAAHIHSPITGHGMNTGIQDAYNLGWKLALVCQGRADPRLLDSYEAERLPIAETLLAKTDVQTRLLLSRNRIAHGALAALGQLAFRLDAAQRRILASAVELDVCYPGSPIVSEQRGGLLEASLLPDRESEDPCVRDYFSFSAAPGPGDRAPDLALGDPAWAGQRVFDLLRGVEHTLFLFDGLAPTEDGYVNLRSIAEAVEVRWPGLVRTYVIVRGATKPAQLGCDRGLVFDADEALHRRYGATAECLYLVRPDGYVGFRSQPASFSGLEGYMQTLLGRAGAGHARAGIG